VSRLQTRAGSVVLTERSSVLPVVGVGVSVRTGALSDPRGQEGLTRMLARAMRMGPKALSARAVEETLDRLGAQIAVSASQSFVHIGGVVVKKNLEPFVELLASIVLAPAFRPHDLQQVKREMLADLAALGDDDRSLCARHFRSFAFGDHPYGRPRSGTTRSVQGLGREAVIAHHKRLITADNLVFGVWGDFAPKALQALLDRTFGAVSARKPPTLALSEPTQRAGRRILIIDKPERTQSQMMIGTLGTSAHDRDHVALIVGNTAFGGLFSSRLNDEVRVKRGLSYGAGSSFALSRGRDLWAMHTAPAAKDARKTLELQLALYERWVERGLTAAELAAAKRYLEKSHAFEVDTSAKRLDQHLDVELLGFPKNHHSAFLRRVAATSRTDVLQALHRRLSRNDLVIALVATASELLPELRKVPGIAHIDVVPFDAV